MTLLKDKRILAIDDTDAIRSFLRISMEAHGATFYEADTAMGGVRLAKEQNPDLVVLDLGLPDKDGLDILPELKALDGAPNVIILSVRKDLYVKEKARELGADAYLTKPFMMDDLMETIQEYLNQ
ncbi:MAG: response regulator [Rickettsiales bacterium]|nr:response regulator [Rickettsiales bacterium]